MYQLISSAFVDVISLMLSEYFELSFGVSVCAGIFKLVYILTGRSNIRV